MKQTVIELTAPGGSPFAVRFPEPIIAMVEPWPIQTDTAHIVGSKIVMVGLGTLICQEPYEKVKELFTPTQGGKPKLAPAKVFHLGEGKDA